MTLGSGRERTFAAAREQAPLFRDHALAGRHFAKQHAAFCLRSSWRLNQRDRDLIGVRAGILDHGLSNVFDQAALLLERAAFQKINDNFRHSRRSIVVAGLPHPIITISPGAGRACLEIGHVLSESSREGTTGGARNETFGFCSWRIGAWFRRFDTGSRRFLRRTGRTRLLPPLVE